MVVVAGGIVAVEISTINGGKQMVLNGSRMYQPNILPLLMVPVLIELLWTEYIRRQHLTL